jgi:anti-sigma-K factor RskA
MQYKDPELQRRLAGEYVLGTLAGRARERFERLLRRDSGLRDEVVLWQERLMPLAAALPPVAPPLQVWRKVQTRLGMRAASRFGLAFWRNLGLIASTAVVALALYIAVAPMPAPGPAYVAVISDAQAKPAWIVSTRDATLTMKAITPRTLATNQSLELWLLPDGGKPVSLGLMPLSGSKSAQLSALVRGEFAHAQAMAVSVEPTGGSPTGQPTGPVIYQGALIIS